jgi:hypothetical protein
MMGCKRRVSCKNMLRRLEILPFISQYILSLMLFVVKNKNYFTLNLVNYTNSTRQLNNLYQPVTNFAIHQTGVHYIAIKIFNNLPPYIKDTSTNVRKFEICLKQFLHTHTFYTLEEYFQCSSITGRQRVSISLNCVLCHKISCYTCTSFEVLSMYIYISIHWLPIMSWSYTCTV